MAEATTASRAADLVTFQIRNFEALLSAQKAFFDAIAPLGAQQANLLRQGMSSTLEAADALAKAPTPGARFATGLDLMKEALRRNTAMTNMASETLAQASAQAGAIVQARTESALDEVADIVQSAGDTTALASAPASALASALGLAPPRVTDAA